MAICCSLVSFPLDRAIDTVSSFKFHTVTKGSSRLICAVEINKCMILRQRCVVSGAFMVSIYQDLKASKK